MGRVIYVVAALAVSSIAALVFVTRWGMRAKDETMAAADRLHSTTKMADETIMALVKDRDDWKAKHDVVASQLAAAKVRLVTTETQRNKAREDEREHIVEVVRTTDATAAIGILGGVLSNPLPRMPQADSASPGDGHSRAAGVLAAGATDASVAAGRLPKP